MKKKACVIVLAIVILVLFCLQMCIRDRALADIDKRLEELQAELLRLATSHADYDKVGEEIHRLRDEKQKLQLENANREEIKKRIEEMREFMNRQTTETVSYTHLFCK